MRRAAGLALIVLASVLTHPADAAGNRIVYVKKSFPVGPHREKDATVDCAADTQGLGGGVTGSSPRMVMHRDTGGSTGWRGTMFNPTGDRQSMTIVVACVKNSTLPPMTFVTGVTLSSSLAAHSTLAYPVSCGPTRIMTGGGATIAGTDRHTGIVWSGPADGNDADGIENDGFNSALSNDTDATLQITSSLVCIDAAAVGTVTTKELDANAPAHRNVSKSVHCDDKTQVTGGGVTLPTPDIAGALRAEKPTGLRARPPGNGWFTTLNAGTNEQPMKLFARCIAP